jgi:transposase
MTFKEDKIGEAVAINDIRDLIDENHICHFIYFLVDFMDLSEFEDKYAGKPGQIAYNRKAMLRVLIYANYVKITSVRKIEEALNENIIFMYLAGGNFPSYPTINNLRDEFGDIVDKALDKTVEIAKKLGMVKLEKVITDGTYIKGNASLASIINESSLELTNAIIENGLLDDLIIDEEYFKSINQSKIENLQTKDKINEALKIAVKSTNPQIKTLVNEINEKYDDKIIKKYEKKIESDKINSNEIIKDDEFKKRTEFTDKNKKKIKQATEECRKIKLKNPDKEVKINLGDPESIWVKNKKGVFEQGYNIQTTIDSYKGIRLNTSASNDPTDHHQLKPQIETLKNKGYDLNGVTILADSIYGTTDALDYIYDNKLNALIPSRKQAVQNKNKPLKTKNKKISRI